MLYVVKLNDTNGVVQVIQPPRGICIRKLECEIPSRCGHFSRIFFILVLFFTLWTFFYKEIYVFIHYILQILTMTVMFI